MYKIKYRKNPMIIFSNHFFIQKQGCHSDFLEISIKGESGMDYGIETKEVLDVFGIEAVCSLTGGYKTVHFPAQTYVIFSSVKFKWGDEFFKILTNMQK